MSLKASRYNFFFPVDDGKILAYNSLSGSFASLTADKYKIADKILEDPETFDYSNEEDAKLRGDLRRGSYLVEKDLDEIGLLKLKNKTGRFQTNALGMTIAPTMACNFKCTYCFEEAAPATMTPEIEAATIAFIEQRLKNTDMLSVSWFGGEPTLRMDVIERMTLKLKELCKTHEVKFPNSMIVTNGYLLTAETAQKLKDLNITQAQVTIDGPPEIHDARRMMTNNRGTFQTIMDNIKASRDILNIVVRVNVDKDNLPHMERLIDIFWDSGFAGKVPFYFAPVASNTEACSDMASVCFTTRENSMMLVDLQKKARAKGFDMTGFPRASHFGYCGADRLNSYVVGPTGHLFKCWNEMNAGDRATVGHIQGGVPTAAQLNHLGSYLNWDPFLHPDCGECKYMPICSGGCPFNSQQQDDKKSCTDFKYNLDEMLRVKYYDMTAKAKQAAQVKNQNTK